MESLRARIGLAVAGILLAAIWFAPNVVNFENKWWFSKQKLNYGLDIQGGLHLVMGVDVQGVVRESTQRLANVLKEEMKASNISYTGLTATQPESGQLEIQVSGTAAAEAVKGFLNERYAAMLQVMESSDSQVVVRYYDSYLMDYKQKVILQAIETIRNRIDEFGVAEPSIAQQGEDRILVQLPGLADAERAKALINTAAKLDFMIVRDDANLDLTPLVAEAEKAGNYNLGTLKYTEYINRLNQDLAAKLPPKTMVLFEKSENAASMEVGKIPYLLSTDTGLGGESLDDATISFDQYGSPEVAIRFNALGTNKFKTLTSENIGKRMAIVLDRVVKTAPVIQTQIGDGRAVITLGGGRDREQSLEEAKMISTSLRAGSLPASLEQLEERRIGPSLGADSLKKAELGAVVGAILIFLFMALRYKTMGLITDVVLALNIFAGLALLTSLGATLTLPGIAGIALTVGFAVDANVLINERIRDELAKGASLMTAIKEGYNRAMSAILDANATTAATALVLLYFGTGPVRGFAVTLLIGIGTTMFANVFVSKVIVDILVQRFKVKKLSV